MEPNIVCVDWFSRAGSATTRLPQKDWNSLAPNCVVIDIFDQGLDRIDFPQVLLLVIHESVQNKAPQQYADLLKRLSRMDEGPFVMEVSAQRGNPKILDERGKWYRTGVPFPRMLSHLQIPMSKLLQHLKKVSQPSDGPDALRERLQIWREWESATRTAIIDALYLLCQGYLAAGGGAGLSGWTPELRCRVTINPAEVSRKSWWIQGIFESGEVFQKAILSELRAQNVVDLPEGLRGLVRMIASGKEEVVEKSVVQKAFDTLISMEGVK